MHVWNEKMTLTNGIKVVFCKCKNWLPPLCMGFKDTIVCRMHCREFLCPKCCENLPEGELTGKPLHTIEEFLKLNGMSKEDDKNDKT